MKFIRYACYHDFDLKDIKQNLEIVSSLKA